MKINNSKNLQVGNIVKHQRGWTGRVTAVEYINPTNGYTMVDGSTHHSPFNPNIVRINIIGVRIIRTKNGIYN